MSIISLLRCTGVRRGELIALEWSDTDFDDDAIGLRNETVKLRQGTRRRFRRSPPVKPCGRIAAASDDREWTVAATSRRGTDRVWVSRNGVLTPTGVSQVLRRRSKARRRDPAARTPFRRCLAVRWLRGGGSETHLSAGGMWPSSLWRRRWLNHST